LSSSWLHLLKSGSLRETRGDSDSSIADIEVASTQTAVRSIRFDLTTGKREEEIGEQTVDEVKAHHITEQGKAVF
jgi:hypothetical protein